MIALSVKGLIVLIIIVFYFGMFFGMLMLGLAHSAALQDADKQREHPERRYF